MDGVKRPRVEVCRDNDECAASLTTVGTISTVVLDHVLSRRGRRTVYERSPVGGGLRDGGMRDQCLCEIAAFE